MNNWRKILLIVSMLCVMTVTVMAQTEDDLSTVDVTPLIVSHIDTAPDEGPFFVYTVRQQQAMLWAVENSVNIARYNDAVDALNEAQQLVLVQQDEIDQLTRRRDGWRTATFTLAGTIALAGLVTGLVMELR